VTVKIVTDSASDLPPELIKELDITIVPARVIFNNKSYRDGVDISQEEVYHKMVDESIPTTTSQPPPGDFASVYKKLLKEAESIISIQTTSKLSGIYSSALQGKEMVGGGDRIEVVDSLTTTMALGLITLMAARLAKAGESFSRILEETRQSVPHTHAWAYFDTLKYLFQGGRLGKAKTLLGSMLPVKALLVMRDGELHPSGLVRTRARGIERLIENFKKAVDVQEAAVVYSTIPDDAQTIKERLSAVFDRGSIHISRLGSALGVHGGPGMLGLAFREKATDLGQEATITDRLKKHISLPSIHRPKLSFSRL